MKNRMGVVAIGRNEGERLERCLRSARRDCEDVVYVDSGSTDKSVWLARSLGVAVVELDMSRPFSAARGRNEGFRRLLLLRPDLKFVLFVDGDCEIAKGWIEAGCSALDADETLAAVCGRRRERYPNSSLFNRICDIEWDTPVGEAKACGGDAILRVDAFEKVGGFDEDVIAAEDDEICVRLRASGYHVHRIDAEMTLHDADMHTTYQWWRRAVRAGHGFAQGFAMHGAPPERHFFKPLRGVLLWSFVFPCVALLLAAPTHGASLAVLVAAYGLLWIKTTRYCVRRGLPVKLSALYATNCVFAKFPELVGVAKYAASKLQNKSTRIIEYK